MPRREVSMHKIREIFRLHFEIHLSQHQIAGSLGLSVGVVHKYLKQAQAVELVWSVAQEMNEVELRRLLRGEAPVRCYRYSEPDYAVMYLESQRKGVTLQLLWEEYRANHGDRSYSYSQYCRRYNKWLSKQKPSMRQQHRAGEKLFIDYCGPTVGIADPDTGQMGKAQIFVAVLGASNYTYAEASWSQSLPDWIAAHVNAFDFFGGIPALLVPDNLKSAVAKACRYEPEVNSTYGELARHYGTAILPTRPYKPKDKAKVENAVLVVERWILARLRHQSFFSLHALNQAIKSLLKELNERPFKKMSGCRRSLFETLDKPALLPLPAQSYVYAQWKKARVHMDYHVEVDGHYYSVPFSLMKEEVDVRLTTCIVECFYQGKRIASHVRSRKRSGHTSCLEHMPKSHQKHLEWTPDRFLNWGKSIGSATYQVVKYLLENKPHPEHGYRSCLGLLSLGKHYNKTRLESACQRSLTLGVPSRKSVASILKTGLDQQPFLTAKPEKPPLHHDNIRGSSYYNPKGA